MEPLELLEPWELLLEPDDDRFELSELDSLLDDLRSDVVEPFELVDLPLESFELRLVDLFDVEVAALPPAGVDFLPVTRLDDLGGELSEEVPEASVCVLLGDLLASPVVGACRLLPLFGASERSWLSVDLSGEPCCCVVPAVPDTLDVPVLRSGDGVLLVPLLDASWPADCLVGASTDCGARSSGAVMMRPCATVLSVTWAWPTVLASSWTAAATGSVAACPPSAAAPASEPTVSTAPVAVASRMRGALEYSVAGR